MQSTQEDMAGVTRECTVSIRQPPQPCACVPQSSHLGPPQPDNSLDEKNSLIEYYNDLKAIAGSCPSERRDISYRVRGELSRIISNIHGKIWPVHKTLDPRARFVGMSDVLVWEIMADWCASSNTEVKSARKFLEGIDGNTDITDFLKLDLYKKTLQGKCPIDKNAEQTILHMGSLAILARDTPFFVAPRKKGDHENDTREEMEFFRSAVAIADDIGGAYCPTDGDEEREARLKQAPLFDLLCKGAQSLGLAGTQTHDLIMTVSSHALDWVFGCINFADGEHEYPEVDQIIQVSDLYFCHTHTHTHTA